MRYPLDSASSRRCFLGFSIVIWIASTTVQLQADCNFNGIEDRDDIASGRSADCDENGVPDECDAFPLPIAEVVPVVDGRGGAAVVRGDFNDDGLVDFANWQLSENFARELLIHLNLGQRDFETTALTTEESLVALATVDFDNDGDLDLVALSSNAIYQTRNEGEGRFGEFILTPVEGTPTDIQIADLDADGLPDLVFPDRVLDSAIVHLNQGDGTFGAPRQYPVGDYPRALLATDIDGDGDIDLVTANSTSKEILVQLNTGEGMFENGASFPTESTGYKIVHLDLDRDGSREILIAMRQKILALELVGGALREIYSIPLARTFSTAYAMVAVDVNVDGALDLLVSYSGQGALAVLGGPRERRVVRHPITEETFFGLVAADFDEDGNLDFVAPSRENLFMIWSGEPRPAPGFTNDEFRHTAEPHWSSVADMDGDGDLDVAVSDGGVSSVSIQFNDGNGRLAEVTPYRENGYVNSITTADFDQDGTMDLAVTSWRNNQAIVHLRGEGARLRRAYTVGRGTFFVGNGHFNDDAFPDIVTCNPGSNTVSILLNRGDGTFGAPQTIQVGSSPQIATPADIDGDQDLDLVIGNVGSSVSLLTNDGDGRFQESTREPIPQMLSVRPIDLDSDGDPDLAVTHSSNRVLLLENEGGEFVHRASARMDRAPSWVIPADLNQDGIVDLITSNTDRGPTFPPNMNPAQRQGSLTIFIGNGPFSFDPPQTINIGFDPRSLHAADMDGDNLQDIVVINHDSRTLTVLLNRTRAPTSGPYVETFCTEADFFRLSIPSRGGSRQRVLKFITPADPSDESLLPTLYQNVRLEPLHQEFLAKNFPDRFPLLTRDRYDALVHRRATRDYFVGNLYLLRKTGRTFYGFSVITGAFDDATELPRQNEVKQVFDNLHATFALRDLVYYPETAAERESASAFDDPAFEVFLEEAASTSRFEAYTQGVSYGRVRILDPDELNEANDSGRFGFQDIVVLAESPRDIEGVVGGVITAVQQTAASHVAVRTARRGTPNAYVAEAEGQLIRFEVGERDYSFRPATIAEAEEWWAANQRTLSEDPSVDATFTALPTLAEIELDGETDPTARVGGKAANFARLQRALVGEFETYRADGFAIPHHYYLKFLRTNRTLSFVRPLQVVTYEEYIEELFASEEFQTNSTFRFNALERLRDAMVDGGEVDSELVARIAARIGEVFGGTSINVRFRSSSNAEDAVEFNGAGLYNSYSACAADDLDDDEDGPSECDSSESNERGIARTLKRVWASLWNSRAHEERAFYSMPHESLSMAILVTRGFSEELANGVVFTANPANPFDRRYQVSVQAGERSVVSPEPGEVAEIDLLEVPAGQVTKIVRAVSSSLLAGGTFVLSDEQLAELGALVWHVDANLEIDLGPYDRDRVLLDIEFKFDRDGRLAIKQVRPFLTNETSAESPEFRLAVPEGSKVCGTFLEFRSPLDTWLLKSDLELLPGATTLPTNKSYFTGENLFGRLRLGPARSEARSVGDGIYRVAKNPTDASSFTFRYEQEYVLEDGTPYRLSLDGVTLRAGESETFTLDGEAIEGFVSLQGNVDGAVVNYGSCTYESLRLWEIFVALGDGSRVHLYERHEPPLSITDTAPARLNRAELSIRGSDHVVTDYWNLVYTAARHNVTVEYWVVLDPPIRVEGIDTAIRAIEIIAPEPSLGVDAAVNYLDERFEVAETTVVANFVRREITEPPPATFQRGDVDADGQVQLTDAIRLLDHLFLQGAAPTCRSAGDSNDDGSLNLTDAVLILDHLFRGVEALPAPFGRCGEDETGDDLDCLSFAPCG